MPDDALKSLADYKPFDPATLACPHAGWALLQKEAPVYKAEVPGLSGTRVFFVTRKREIEYVAQHPELFSHEPVASVWRWGDFEPEIACVFARKGAQKVVHTLQSSNSPEGLKYRKVVESYLNPRRIEAWKPEIYAVIDRLLAAIPSNEPVDAVESFCVPLPLQMICMILGLPYEDEKFLRFETDELTHLVDPTHPHERAMKAAETVADGFNYLEGYLRKFRETPADNLMSAYANARGPDGELFTMAEAVSMAHTTVIGGNETTRNGIASALYTLAKRKDLWRRLKAEPNRVPDFVEEVLRVAAPAAFTPRTVLQDTELAGVQLKKGDSLFVMWAAGSVDGSVFPEPEKIDLDRKNKRAHTTFGIGARFCAGIFLARAELNFSIERWLKAFESIEFAVPEAEISYAPVLAFRTFPSVPLRCIRASSDAAAS